MPKSASTSARPASSRTASAKTAAAKRVSSKKAVVSPHRTQQERREEAELRLLEAARQIIARKGWVGMTLAEVGEAAGFSRGLAAHHFGSKSMLLRAVAAYINQTFLREIQSSMPQQEGVHALLGFVDGYLKRSDPQWTNTRALLMMMVEATAEDSETGEGLRPATTKASFKFSKGSSALALKKAKSGLRSIQWPLPRSFSAVCGEP